MYNDYMYIHDDFLLLHHLLGEWRMTKAWKSEKIWWDFLTRLEQIALRFPWISPAFFWQQSYVLKKHIYFLSFYVPTTTFIVSFNLETICWYIHSTYCILVIENPARRNAKSKFLAFRRAGLHTYCILVIENPARRKAKKR